LPGEKQPTCRILTQAVHGRQLKNEFAVNEMVLRNLIILPEAEQDVAEAYIWYER